MKRDVAQCVHEEAVLDVAASGTWPGEASSALVGHVARCPVCRDLVTVVTALAGDDHTPAATGPMLDADAIWHRARMAARHDAACRAAQPVQLAQIAAGAIGLLLAVAWAGGTMGTVVQSTVAFWVVSLGEVREWIGGLRFQPIEPDIVSLTWLVYDRPVLAGFGTATMLGLTAYGISCLADRIREP